MAAVGQKLPVTHSIEKPFERLLHFKSSPTLSESEIHASFCSDA